jgi:Putative peptidoglycan binding domain
VRDSSTATFNLDLSDASNVIRVQARLTELGYLKDFADGRWGSRTRAALGIFKEGNGLPADDKWGTRQQIGHLGRTRSGRLATCRRHAHDEGSSTAILQNPQYIRCRSLCYTSRMTLNERILYHQVHPAKLAADIAAEVISLYFFWQHALAPALLTHFIPPILASAVLLGSGKDFGNIQRSRLGHYLRRYMTPAAQLTRLLGDVVTVFAAWWHSLLGIAVGLLVVVGAWGFGLVFPSAKSIDR